MMKDQYLQIIVLLVQKEAQKKGKVPNPVKHGKQEKQGKQGKQQLEDIVKL